MVKATWNQASPEGKYIHLSREESNIDIHVHVHRLPAILPTLCALRDCCQSKSLEHLYFQNYFPWSSWGGLHFHCCLDSLSNLQTVTSGNRTKRLPLLYYFSRPLQTIVGLGCGLVVELTENKTQVWETTKNIFNWKSALRKREYNFKSILYNRLCYIVDFKTGWVLFVCLSHHRNIVLQRLCTAARWKNWVDSVSSQGLMQSCLVKVPMGISSLSLALALTAVGV